MKKKFGNLRVNDTFEYQSRFYMVTHKITINDSASNAVALDTHERYWFDANTEVTAWLH